MILGLCAGFFAASCGWQINLLAIHRGILRGHLAAFLVGCGAATADMIFISIGFTGTRFLENHPEWWGIIRWVGVAVLLSIAARTFFIQPQTSRSLAEVAEKNPTRNFLVGFLVGITNPAVFLMWIGVLSLIRTHFAEAGEAGFKERFLLGYLSGAMAWFIPFAFVFMKKLRKWTENRHTFISKLSAVTLVMVAVFLMVYDRF